jgi:hypothetical protein
LQDDAGDDDPDEKQDERKRHSADQGVLAETVEPLREVTARSILQENASGAAEADEPGQGHHK